jgi:ABC-type branched-subunit amino acid transport system substrate-binding protein
MLAVAAPSASAQHETAKIAVALSLTGPNASIGRPDLEGARLAVEEANAAGGTPTIELSVYDDASNIAEGKRLAKEISAGDALLVLGPGTTAMALDTGPIYSDAGVVAIGPTTTGDKVTDPKNFFRGEFSTSDAGEILASYIRYNLGGRRAIVLLKDDSYGHAVADGFKRAADWLGVTAELRPYKTADEAEAVASFAAADITNPAIILAAYDLDTVPVLKALRRQGARGPILGSVSIAGDTYNFVRRRTGGTPDARILYRRGVRGNAGCVRQRQCRDARVRRPFSRPLRPRADALGRAGLRNRAPRHRGGAGHRRRDRDCGSGRAPSRDPRLSGLAR